MLELTPLEQEILNRSSDSDVTKRRKLIVLFAGSLTAVVIGALLLWFESRAAAAAIGVLYVVVTTGEKWAYGNAVLGYKSLIQKLAKRIDEVEAHSA